MGRFPHDDSLGWELPRAGKFARFMQRLGRRDDGRRTSHPLDDRARSVLGPIRTHGNRAGAGGQLLMALGGTGWTIELDAQGKPIARGPFARHVSIAHSRNIVAAAASAWVLSASTSSIGIPHAIWIAWPQAAYGAEECRAVASCGLSAFYRIWTVREAISKATGDGMALVTDRTDRVPAAMADGSVCGGARRLGARPRRDRAGFQPGTGGPCGLAAGQARPPGPHFGRLARCLALFRPGRRRRSARGTTGPGKRRAQVSPRPGRRRLGHSLLHGPT